MSTNIGKVRLNIPDTNVVDAIFTDDEIQSFLDQEQDNIFFAAADAVDTLATNQAYVLKVKTTGDLTFNGAAVSAELRARATALRVRGQQLNGSAEVNTGVAIVRNHRMLRGF